MPLAAAAMGLAVCSASANEFAPQLTELANGDIAAIAQSAEVVAAVKAQNAETSGYDQAKIDALDKQWRAEVGASDQPLISATLAKPASVFLAGKREASGGLFSEIFVTDAKGLNVAQSDVTSDYWQGDEAKWQKSFPMGAGAIHLGDVEQDESTQAYQSQVSMTVTDPDSGEPIGAITVGVNVELLN
ncbi:hypothetical protein D1F64_07040 [Breoghania sp. L-A4]|nr:hypothetical protein D1F64_07040 [Breoghania sp. L-A4]